MRNPIKKAYLYCLCITALAQGKHHSSLHEIKLQFTGTTIENVANFLRAQPNCNGDVGPTQYIQITNQHIRSFDKKTGKPDGILDIDSGTLLGAYNADAMIIFDSWGQRWIASGIIGDPTHTVYPYFTIGIAWSDGPIISQDSIWSTYHFPPNVIVPPTGGFVDSPKLACDQNAVYLNTDTFDSAFNFGTGVSAVIIPHCSFHLGNKFNYTIIPHLFNPNEYPLQGGLSFAPSPTNYDSDPEFGYIVVSPVSTGIIASEFYLLRIIDPGSNHPVVYPSSANPIIIPTPSYAIAPQVPHKGNLYGHNGLLENFTSLDGSIHVRHHQLFVSIVVLVDQMGNASLTGDRTGILWCQYDLTGDPSGCANGCETKDTIPVLVQSGIIFDPSVTETPKNYWNQSLMTDLDNNMIIIGNYAGLNDYIQAFYTERLVTDPLGSLRTIIPFTNNNVSYNFGTLLPTDANGDRWGDYCSLRPDPCNQQILWATNQIVAFQDGWGILTSQLVPAAKKCKK